jgi:hypothetical protein
MPGHFNLPNKAGSERPFNLEQDIVLSIEYLFVFWMLKLAYENSIKHRDLINQRFHIMEDISHYKEGIEVCESNLSVCEQSIQKSNDYLLEKEATKKNFLDLHQEFSRMGAKQQLGDFPKTVNEIELRTHFITDIYKFRLFPVGMPLPELNDNTIDLKINTVKKTVFFRLKTSIGSPVQGYLAVNELWLARKETENFQCDIKGLSAKNISEFYISLLENLAKRGLIPDPYEKELNLYLERIKHLGNLIEDAYTKLERMQTIQATNLRQKEEYETQLGAAHEKLAEIEMELESIPGQSAPQTALENPPYRRLEFVQPSFFASRNRRGPAIEKPYQLDVVHPQFFGGRESNKAAIQKKGNLIFTLNKSYQN